MKKVICAVLVIVLAVLAVGCGKTEYPDFTEKGMDVIALMEEMVNSDEYIEGLQTPSEAMAIVQSLADGDYDDVDCIYEITFPHEPEEFFEDYDDLSSSLQKVVRSKSFSAYITSMNNMMGSRAIVATALFTAGEMFLTDAAESTVYIYTFDKGTPIAVTFVVNSEGICSASGTFLMLDTLDFSSAKALEESLPFDDCDVKKIK